MALDRKGHPSSRMVVDTYKLKAFRRQAFGITNSLGYVAHKARVGSPTDITDAVLGIARDLLDIKDKFGLKVGELFETYAAQDYGTFPEFSESAEKKAIQERAYAGHTVKRARLKPGARETLREFWEKEEPGLGMEPIGFECGGGRANIWQGNGYLRRDLRKHTNEEGKAKYREFRGFVEGYIPEGCGTLWIGCDGSMYYTVPNETKSSESPNTLVYPTQPRRPSRG
ncbi:hypothetical protein AGMMS50296_3510 [Alphaproteobacteria bacterium]|nr:hypothetical protein AGMMS50296_3510 [Alphaproteobacteria bacterium]